MYTKILENILVSYYPGWGGVLFEKKTILGWDGGWVSDPQNCKIQEVPGCFLKTILEGFLNFFLQICNENKGWSNIVSFEDTQVSMYF